MENVSGTRHSITSAINQTTEFPSGNSSWRGTAVTVKNGVNTFFRSVDPRFSPETIKQPGVTMPCVSPAPESLKETAINGALFIGRMVMPVAVSGTASLLLQAYTAHIPESSRPAAGAKPLEQTAVETEKPIKPDDDEKRPAASGQKPADSAIYRKSFSSCNSPWAGKLIAGSILFSCQQTATGQDCQTEGKDYYKFWQWRGGILRIDPFSDGDACTGNQRILSICKGFCATDDVSDTSTDFGYHNNVKLDRCQGGLEAISSGQLFEKTLAEKVYGCTSRYVKVGARGYMVLLENRDRCLKDYMEGECSRAIQTINNTETSASERKQLQHGNLCKLCNAAVNVQLRCDGPDVNTPITPESTTEPLASPTSQQTATGQDCLPAGKDYYKFWEWNGAIHRIDLISNGGICTDNQRIPLSCEKFCSNVTGYIDQHCHHESVEFDRCKGGMEAISSGQLFEITLAEKNYGCTSRYEQDVEGHDGYMVLTENRDQCLEDYLRGECSGAISTLNSAETTTSEREKLQQGNLCKLCNVADDEHMRCDGPDVNPPTIRGPTTPAHTTSAPTARGLTTSAPTSREPTTSIPTTRGPTTILTTEELTSPTKNATLTTALPAITLGPASNASATPPATGLATSIPNTATTRLTSGPVTPTTEPMASSAKNATLTSAVPAITLGPASNATPTPPATGLVTSNTYPAITQLTAGNNSGTSIPENASYENPAAIAEGRSMGAEVIVPCALLTATAGGVLFYGGYHWYQGYYRDGLRGMALLLCPVTRASASLRATCERDRSDSETLELDRLVLPEAEPKELTFDINTEDESAEAGFFLKDQKV